ncbi:hypothetical protein KCU78_g14, partial [Aureobasidium melanogenum]
MSSVRIELSRVSVRRGLYASVRPLLPHRAIPLVTAIWLRVHSRPADTSEYRAKIIKALSVLASAAVKARTAHIASQYRCMWEQPSCRVLCMEVKIAQAGYKPCEQEQALSSKRPEPGKAYLPGNCFGRHAAILINTQQWTTACNISQTSCVTQQFSCPQIELSVPHILRRANPDMKCLGGDIATGGQGATFIEFRNIGTMRNISCCSIASRTTLATASRIYDGCRTAARQLTSEALAASTTTDSALRSRACDTRRTAVGFYAITAC